MVIRARPKPATDIQPPKPVVPPDAMKRFDATGWLRYDKHATGRGRYRLEKGRKLIAYVTCTSGRYDLKLFDGIELGVRGGRQVGGEPVAPVIDVDRVEVIGIEL